MKTSGAGRWLQWHWLQTQACSGFWSVGRVSPTPHCALRISPAPQHSARPTATMSSSHLKVCSGCAQSLPESQFSGAQIKKKGKRRCKACCGATTTSGGAGGSAASHSAAAASPPMFVAASDDSSSGDGDAPPPPPPPRDHRTRSADTDAVAWERFCVAHGLSLSSPMPHIPADVSGGDHDATRARVFTAALGNAYFSASARPPDFAASAAMAASVFYGQRNKSGQPHGEGLRLNEQGDIVNCQCGTWQAGNLVRQGAILRASLPIDTPLREHGHTHSNTNAGESSKRESNEGERTK